jgi:glycosyltransferase involved in cell wall biosynthesis
MKPFLYFEPFSGGHCAYYAESILAAARADPRLSEVSLIASPELIGRLKNSGKFDDLRTTALTVDELAQLTTGNLIGRGLRQWSHARDLIEGAEGGICFMPYFDHALPWAILDRRPVEGTITGIIFRPPNPYGHTASLSLEINALIRWFMYLGSIRPAVPKLFTLDERATQSGIGKITKRLTFLPDPAPDLGLLEACQSNLRADGRLTYLLFGALRTRKGIVKLMAALPKLDITVQSRIAVRLVGRIDSKERSSIEAAIATARAEAPNLVIELFDAFLTDQELAQEIVNADVILAPYQNHIGSSGTLYWAAAAGKPVLSQRTGLMGYQVSRHDLGKTIDSTDPDAISLGISQDFGNWHPSNPKIFLDQHTGDVFSRIILETLL